MNQIDERTPEGATFEALNLAEHAHNPIHTDAGARAAGFPAALVAGVSVYAYMTHVPVVAWGEAWIEQGGAEVRFVSPVFDRDRLECSPTGSGGSWQVDATVGGELRASAALWQRTEFDPAGSLEQRAGEELPPLEVELDHSWVDYAVRLGDPLGIYADKAIVHPAAWPSLANTVMHNQVVVGSWIHTRSRIHHRSAAHEGQTAVVSGIVVERFETRSGRRAIVDFSITADGELVAQIEHEAIIEVFAKE